MTRDNERINKKEFNEQKIKFLNIQLIATIGFILGGILLFVSDLFLIFSLLIKSYL